MTGRRSPGALGIVMAPSERDNQIQPVTQDAGAPTVVICVAPAPHLSATSPTTRRMMIDVIVALAPVMVMAVIIFRWYAVAQVGVCVLTCLAADTACAWMRGKRAAIGDFSAAVTGMILGLSLPWSAPWYVAVIGSVAAIGIGKAAFGGLGCNIFNPAMVGRAFVMLSFAPAMGASAYVSPHATLAVVTQATPLTLAKQVAADVAAGMAVPGDIQMQFEAARRLWLLFLGNLNGSLGETSALAALIGGVYLCARRTAAWQIPAGCIMAALALAGLANWGGLTPFTALHHLLAGALLFGAFFIATDPVTSPVTPTGRFIFGLGVGALAIMLRVLSGYPEGIMFAILLMNGVAPMLNRWTIPRPLGGSARGKEAAEA